MRLVLIPVFLLSFLTVTDSATAQSTTDNIIVVQMVDKSSAEWRFEPENITVKQGDIVRFVQADVMPHNVEFKTVPEGADLSELLFGRFLMTKGETYEFTIDERFVVGTFEFVCTPHTALGMKGSLTLVSEKTTPTK